MYLLFHGNINAETSEGTNNLIKQGAKLVTDSKEIIEELENRNIDYFK